MTMSNKRSSAFEIKIECTPRSENPAATHMAANVSNADIFSSCEKL